jgi:hypothetical protein
VHGVLGNRLRSAKALGLASHEPSVSRETVAEVPLTGLSCQLCGVGHSSSEWNTAYQGASRLGLEFINTALPERWDSFLRFGAEAPTHQEFMQREKPVVIRLPYIKWGGG